MNNLLIRFIVPLDDVSRKLWATIPTYAVDEGYTPMEMFVSDSNFPPSLRFIELQEEKIIPSSARFMGHDRGFIEHDEEA